jgi:hypothetical protein
MPGFFTASTFLFWLPLTLLLAASTLNTKGRALGLVAIPARA